MLELVNAQVWQITVDVRLLDYDGNLVDAVCAAVMAALSLCRRPEVNVVGEEATIVFFFGYYALLVLEFDRYQATDWPKYALCSDLCYVCIL